MDRPQLGALTAQEIEAFQNGFDHIPPLHTIQPRFRLKGLFKLYAFAAAFHVLSFGSIEPNELPLVMTILMQNNVPSWTAFETFPLVVKFESVWPLPDLEMPPLALTTPVRMVAIKPPSSTNNQIRLGDGPALTPSQSGGTTKMASSVSPPVSSAPVTASKQPQASPKTQTNTSNFVDAIVKSFNQVTAQQKNASSIKGSSPNFETVRDNFSSFKGVGPSAPSPASGGLFGGLRKG